MIRFKTFYFFLAIAAIVCAVTFHLPAWSKAYYPTIKETIQRSDCIALVMIEKCEAKDTKGSPYNFQQESVATVKLMIKGNLPKQLTILGAEDFECARCQFPVGESIVFLRKNGEAYSGVGWNIANLRVTNGKVPWFKSLESRNSDVAVEIKSAIAEIKKAMTITK